MSGSVILDVTSAQIFCGEGRDRPCSTGIYLPKLASHLVLRGGRPTGRRRGEAGRATAASGSTSLTGVVMTAWGVVPEVAGGGVWRLLVPEAGNLMVAGAGAGGAITPGVGLGVSVTLTLSRSQFSSELGSFFAVGGLGAGGSCVGGALLGW